MKKYIVFLCVSIGIINSELYSTQTELDFFKDYTGAPQITVTIYPVSAVFTGNEPIQEYEYTLAARLPQDYVTPQYVHLRWDYIAGVRYINGEKKNTIILIDGVVIGLNFDPHATTTMSGNWGVFGYGIYKIVFSWTPVNGSDDGFEECYYDIDAGQNIDLTFIVKRVSGIPAIYYHFKENYPTGRNYYYHIRKSKSGIWKHCILPDYILPIICWERI